MFKRQKSIRLGLAFTALVLISIFTFASTGGYTWLVSAENENASASKNSEPSLKPFTAGVCDTAGPIEVESTGGSLAGTPTAYATLGGAFTAINGAALHLGTITIDICGDTNEAAVSAVLNQVAGVTSITMSPAGGAARTITGAPAGGTPMIDINGADSVTINGLNTGGNSLTISNTTVSATSNTSTIRLQTDASNNTITNSSILGSSTMAVGTNGGNIIITSGAVTTGNDNNTISNNNIGPAGANLPTKGIYFSGSSNTDPGTGNSGNIVTGNNIFDYFGAAVTSAGIYVSSGTTGGTFSNNKFYQTATRTQTTGAQHSAIWITNTSGNNYQVTGNTIGFAAANGTGTYNFVAVSSSSVLIPIFLSVGTTTATSVQGNTIAGIAMSGAGAGTSSSAAFRGIYVSSGLATVGDVTGNTIGSQSATGSITYTSNSTSASDVIGIFNFGSSNFVTNNNTVGGITASNSSTGAANIYGIRTNTGSGVTWICNGNTVGGTIANSINSTSTAAGTVVDGILNSNPIGTFTSNTIRNMTVAGGTGTTTTASMAGIVMNNTVNNTLSRNTITTLSNTNTTAATVVTGIQFSGSGTANVVERNLITGLTSATNSATAEVNGIRVGAGTTIYRNNMINIGAGIANALGAVATNSSTAAINGINEALGTDQFFHNSVYIGGTATAGTGASFAFNGTQTVNTRSFRNNIFFNGRTNSGATGKNYAIKLNGTTPNPTGLTINNNDYFANGSGAVFGFYNSLDVANLAGWKAAVGQDANSIEADPLFVSTTDLHETSTSPTRDIGASTLGVTNDFDGKSRPGGNALFDIGADEFDGVTPAVNDVQATAFINPTNGSSILVGSTFAPQASFTNNGTANQTNVTVRYRICADIACTSVIYNQTFVIPAIASLQTINVTFPSTSLSPAGTYYIRARAELVGDTVTANDEISGTLNVENPLSGTYTVGTGGNFTSLTNSGGLFQTINNLGVTSNLTINITSDLTGETGANALNQIAGGFTVLIKPSGAARTISSTATAVQLIKLNGADGVTIDGSLSGGTDRSLTLSVTNATTNGTTVVFVGSAGVGAGATNNTIKNTVIQNGASFGASATAFNFGIYVGNTSGASAGPDNDNLTIQNNLIQKVNLGIQTIGDTTGLNDNTVIADNTFGGTAVADYIGGVGLLIGQSTGASITRNTVRNIFQSANIDIQGIFVSSGVVNSSVTRNSVSNMEQSSTIDYGATGIWVSTAAAASNVTIANNFVYDIRGESSTTSFINDTVAGIRITGTNTGGINVYHNSVNLFGSYPGNASATITAAFMVTATTPTALNVRDNIFVNTFDNSSGIGDKSYAIYTTSANTMFTDINYNDYFVSAAAPGVLGAINSTDATTLLALQTATTKDAQSKNVDPLFVTNNDLHLQGGSTLTNIGQTIAGIANDFDNDLRDTTPDIGADEIVMGFNGTVPAGTYRDAFINTATLGGNVTITGNLTLGGIVTTGGNTLTIACGATVSGAGGNNYVVGNVKKDFCATGSFVFPVGTTPDSINGTRNLGSPSEYSPVTANVTALGTNPSSLTVSVTDAFLAGSNTANSASRYWTLTETGDLTADLSFTYLDLDIAGTESTYKVLKREAGVTTASITSSNNPGTNTGTVLGVSNFSDWAVGNVAPPTSANVAVGGRVLMPDGISGMPRARITLTGGNLAEPITAMTNPFGYYNFENLEVGQTYVLTIGSKQYRFSPASIAITPDDNIQNADFIARPPIVDIIQ
jgi:hypothetical protein